MMSIDLEFDVRMLFLRAPRSGQGKGWVVSLTYGSFRGSLGSFF